MARTLEEEIFAANSGAIRSALAELGVTPELALHSEGLDRAPGLPREELENLTDGLPSDDIPWYTPPNRPEFHWEMANAGTNPATLPPGRRMMEVQGRYIPAGPPPVLRLRTTPGSETPTPRELRREALAAVTRIPSGIAGLIDPTLRDDWRAAQAANPYRRRASGERRLNTLDKPSTADAALSPHAPLPPRGPERTSRSDRHSQLTRRAQ